MMKWLKEYSLRWASQHFFLYELLSAHQLKRDNEEDPQTYIGAIQFSYLWSSVYLRRRKWPPHTERRIWLSLHININCDSLHLHFPLRLSVPQPLVHSFIRSQTYLTGRRITTRQASIATRTTFSHLHRHSYCTRKLLCHLLFRIPPHFTCLNIINTPLYICRSSLGSTPEPSALEFGEDSTVQYRRRNAAHSPCNIDLYAVSVMANTWGGTSWRFMPLYRSMIFSV